MVSSNQKKDKFIELAKSRVNRAINMIRLISNLANKSHFKKSHFFLGYFVDPGKIIV